MESMSLKFTRNACAVAAALAALAAPALAETAQTAPAREQKAAATQPQAAPQAQDLAQPPPAAGHDEMADLFEDLKFDSAGTSTWTSASEPEEKIGANGAAIEEEEEAEVTPGEIIAVENSIERWVRDLVAPFVDSKDYSVYVDVSIQSDPVKLRAYRKQQEERNLPGLVPGADESQQARENPLFSLVDKKKIILVFLKPIAEAQVKLISEILRAKRLIVDARGDSLTINATAAEKTLWDRALEAFSFQAEEGQPSWLGPLSALVSVSMIFAFGVLIWQVFMLKKGGQIQRQIQIKPTRGRSRGPSATASTTATASQAAAVALKVSKAGAKRLNRLFQQTVRLFRTLVMKQVVPPVWPPKEFVNAAAKARAAAAGASVSATGAQQRPAAPQRVQVVPVGGRYPFRSLRSLKGEVIERAFRGLDPKTLALALLQEDHETLEWVIGHVPDPMKEELVAQAVGLGRDTGLDLAHASAQAKTRVAEAVAGVMAGPAFRGVS
jgi:hypothetical protein